MTTPVSTSDKQHEQVDVRTIWPHEAHDFTPWLAQRRLNELTVEGVHFYGVKIEAVPGAGGSAPEPRFRKVVCPGGWDRDATLPPGPIESEYSRQHGEFFQRLIADVARTGRLPHKPTQMHGPGGRYFPSPGIEGIWYAVSLEGTSDASVTLYIRTAERSLTKHIFDTLEKDREQIDSALTVDSATHWRRHDKYAFSSINVRRDGSINDPPERRDEIRRWMLDLLPRFTDVFESRVAGIVADTDARDQVESCADGRGEQA